MRIAVLRRGGIGDLLCAAPLLSCLQEKIPEAVITLFLEERGYALLPFLFPSMQARVIRKGNKYYQTLKQAVLARNQFDLAICAKTTPMKLSDRFLWLLNAPISMAVSTHRNIVHQREIQTEGHQALRCLKIFDPRVEEIPTRWLPRLQLLDPPLKLDLPRPILLFSLSNRRPASQLHWMRFAEIANRLPCSVLINSIHPHPDADLLQKALKVPSKILPTPSLRELLQAVSTADVVLTGDGGLCHIAAALNKPQVALYACTPLELWRPLGAATCLFDFHNVNHIYPEKIYDALKGILHG